MEEATKQLTPRCVDIAEQGITNSQHAIRYLSALIADGSAGRVTSGMMHGVCNAMGKMLRVVEMEARFGTAGSGPEKTLEFVVDRKPQIVNKAPSMIDIALSKLTNEERKALGLA